MDTKICNTCGKIYPLTNEHYFKNKHCNDGYLNRCKICDKKIREGNKEKISEYRKEHWKTYRNTEKYKNWKAEHKTSQGRKDALKKYNLSDKNKDNQQRYRNTGKDSLSSKRYNQTEKGKMNRTITKYKRRAREEHIIFEYTIEEWEGVCTYFNNECAYCGKSDKLTKDHFVPIIKLGDTTSNNIIPCCRSCNCSKRDKDFFKWYSSRKFYSSQREQKILEYLNYNK